MTNKTIDIPHFRLSIDRHYSLHVAYLDVHIARLPNGFKNFRFVQLSDLHYGRLTSRRHIQQAISLALDTRPDVALFTGDYAQVSASNIRYYIANELSPYRAHALHYKRAVRKNFLEFKDLIEPLATACPTFATLGNHEYMEGKATAMRCLNPLVHWLVNSSALITRDGHSIQISGVDDVKYGKPELDSALSTDKAAKLFAGPESKDKAQEPFFRLLLSHNPDITLCEDRELLNQWNLILCGHTHGGQIRIPGVGPILTQTRQRRYVKGLYVLKTSGLYVSPGVGWGGIKLRLFCPPEITVVTLKQL